MRDAVIIGAVRTPVGRRNGGLAGVHPVDLAGQILQDLGDRTGFDPADGNNVFVLAYDIPTPNATPWPQYR